MKINDKVELLEMTPEHFEESTKIWEQVDGVNVLEGDSYYGLNYFINRNPGISLVAVDREIEEIIATVLGGHDGRRGYVYHLAVLPEYRVDNLAQTMVSECLKRIKQSGIKVCYITVYNNNDQAKKFWEDIGWSNRKDLCTFTKKL